ncbi:MAG: DnaJ domain-containing protein [Fimbriimonadales bacterium]
MGDRLPDYYELLGVSRDASPEEIKRAWARLVRIYTPEKDPKRNHELNQAKTILLDPKARKEYDVSLDYGEEIEELLAEAHEAMEEERWDDAVEPLKEVLAYNKDDLNARFLLAIAHQRGGRPKDACAALVWLTQKAPDSSLYRMVLGQVLEELGRLVDAEVELRRACELAGSDSQPHLELARFLARHDRCPEAEQAIEQAIQADGKVDVSDLDALFELPLIHLRAGQYAMIGQDAQRIAQLLQGADPGLREYAAFRFLNCADALVKVQRYREAVLFVDASKKLAPIPAELANWEAYVRRVASCVSELLRMQEDSNVIKPIGAIAYAHVAHLADWEIDVDPEELLQRSVLALNSLHPATVRSSIHRLRSEYPAIYDLASEHWARIASTAERLMQRWQPQPVSRPAAAVVSGSGTSGCGVLALASLTLFVLTALAVLL